MTYIAYEVFRNYPEMLETASEPLSLFPSSSPLFLSFSPSSSPPSQSSETDRHTTPGSPPNSQGCDDVVHDERHECHAAVVPVASVLGAQAAEVAIEPVERSTESVHSSTVERRAESSEASEDCSSIGILGNFSAENLYILPGDVEWSAKWISVPSLIASLRISETCT